MYRTGKHFLPAFATAAALALAFTLVVIDPSQSRAAEPLESAIDLEQQASREAARSQQRIDQLADETETLVAEYRQVLRETDNLKADNDQLEQLVANQDRELASLDSQLDEVENTQREIVPLVQSMVAVLEEFITLDVPFLPEERRARSAALKQLLGAPEVALKEKYRRTMEAYQVETDYGRTIEAYRGPLALDGTTRTVDFLRVGRVGLFYRALDGSLVGYWDREARAWKELGREHAKSILQGLRIARKQAAPDFIWLPVPAPQAVQ
jgi:hypothetical protein